MAFAEAYRAQVALLIRTLPYVGEERCFALKGGTAINLFLRDMPRLSVDIDLTYLPVAPRAESLAAIDGAMRRIAGRIEQGIPGTRITEGITEGAVVRLTVRAQGVQTKIEVTPVLRGTAFDPVDMQVSAAVEDAFGFAEAQVVSFADLYAGKIVAALDRQHPRDLFDIRDLLANEGITDDLREAFIIYLLSHGRPMAEVLGSRQKEISSAYSRGFLGMTQEPVSLDDLLRARQELVTSVVGGMPEQHRRFLVSFERGGPEWPLLAVRGASDLPAIRWREENLRKIPAGKRDALVMQLREVVGDT
ncbi:MAG: nucleotidyl transferase AbiEii/AbiGii toxin family protein [Bradyrhizobium sp.]|nr:nucleotidyl transferase AbiEii/AbiGii toxin family protein [Bradyrhizobium sp.]